MDQMRDRPKLNGKSVLCQTLSPSGEGPCSRLLIPHQLNIEQMSVLETLPKKKLGQEMLALLPFVLAQGEAGALDIWVYRGYLGYRND